MSKKLMLLAAGALSALAFTALPSGAVAGEPHIKCETFPCTYTVEGSELRFSEHGGGTVWCTKEEGSGAITQSPTEPTKAAKESTTGTVELTFSGCKEQATIFHFACTGTGKEEPSGQIRTGALVTHNIYLNEEKKQGVLLTGFSVTFTCAGGFARSTVTGNLIGELHETKCGTATKTIKWNFTAPAHGTQTWRHITGTGTTYDLELATNHNTTPSSTTGYQTAAVTSTTTLTFNQNVTPTC